jgi:hypothetical protein
MKEHLRFALLLAHYSNRQNNRVYSVSALCLLLIFFKKLPNFLLFLTFTLYQHVNEVDFPENRDDELMNSYEDDQKHKNQRQSKFCTLVFDVV